MTDRTTGSGGAPVTTIVLALAALAVLAFSFSIGKGMAWKSAGAKASLGESTVNGQWTTNKNIGSQHADAALRARVAVIGLLALSRKETTYFQADKDDHGDLMRADGVYEIVMRDLPARWWSITAYGADHFLIPNAADRYSVKGTEVDRAADGTIRITVGGPQQPSNWLPLGDGEGEVTLTLRMYNPDPEAVENLDALELPAIRRVSGG